MAALVMSAQAVAAPVTATAADGFVESIGVNIHLHYNDTIYGDFPKLKSALAEVGVRHVRDGLVDSTWQPYFNRVNELGAAGIKFTMITNLPMERIEPVSGKMREAIEAFEGPNEVNLNKWTVENARTYQRDLSHTVKASSFAKTPVLALSVTDFKWAKELGDISAWCDFGNVHPYPGGWEPENGANWMRADLASGIETARANGGTKPIMITETGYQSAVVSGGGHVAVSEQAAGIYLPRLFLHSYRSGVVRTYWYEFFNSRKSASDPEGNFGLYKNDGVTIKPAGRALKHMIGLLADPGPAESPRRLDFTLSDPNAQSVLLEKRNGEFWLALWLKTSLWDNSRPFGQKQEVDPKDADCTVTLNGDFASVTAHEQLDAPAPLKRAIAKTKSFTVTLSERVLFLQITPAIGKLPGRHQLKTFPIRHDRSHPSPIRPRTLRRRPERGAGSRMGICPAARFGRGECEGLRRERRRRDR